MNPSRHFRDTIYWLVWNVPEGKVVTYGQLAAVAGSPRAARIVGSIAHYGPSELPWHRVVKKNGELAEGYPEGAELQKHLLEQEGVDFSGSRINAFDKIAWTIPEAITVPIIVILGQTASGKSSIATKLAVSHNGSIICADAWTLRKGMDIGTAKPSPNDQSVVQHYLIDVIEPDERYSVAQFQQSVLTSIDDVVKKHKTPILVGGNGLYIDSVLFGYRFRDNQDKTLNKKLQYMSLEQIQKIAKEMNSDINNSEYNNKRRLIRLIETGGTAPTRSPVMRTASLVMGIWHESDQLEKRIEERTRQMFTDGLEAEVQSLVDRFGWNTEALKGIGYREFKEYFEGKISKDELITKIIRSNIGYAKRQRTWFKRNKQILWVRDEKEIIRLTEDFLK